MFWVLQICLLLHFLRIFYAFLLQNTLYGSLLQNYAQSEIPIFIHFGSFQDVFSLLKGGKFFTDPWLCLSAGQLPWTNKPISHAVWAS